jgi:hypothetical protein
MIKRSSFALSDKDKCDAMVRRIVRIMSHDECMRCGRSPIQVSHIVARRYSATRCLIENTQPLCVFCHVYFTDHPKEFEIWVEKTIGVDKFQELKIKAQTVTKVNWVEKLIELEGELSDLSTD